MLVRSHLVETWHCVGAEFTGIVFTQDIARSMKALGCDVAFEFESQICGYDRSKAPRDCINCELGLPSYETFIAEDSQYIDRLKSNWLLAPGH